MSGLNYDVKQVEEGYRIREPGQSGQGMLVTHDWLKKMGFGPLSRSNIETVIRATMANIEGGIAPMDIREVGGKRNFPRNFAVHGLAQTRSGLVIAKR